MSPSVSAFDPKELLDVADELVENPTESNIRTVLNRCYYSCYLSIKASRKLLEPSDKLRHINAYHMTSRHGNKAQSYYMSLYRYRIAADYGLTPYPDVGFAEAGIKPSPVKIDQKNARKAISKANKFLELL